jgi:hypothetical protein
MGASYAEAARMRETLGAASLCHPADFDYHRHMPTSRLPGALGT